LNEAGKLIRLVVDDNHLNFGDDWFVNEIVLKYLQ